MCMLHIDVRNVLPSGPQAKRFWQSLSQVGKGSKQLLRGATDKSAREVLPQQQFLTS